MKKDKLIRSLIRLGLMVVDQNGLLTIHSDSVIMYLHSRLYYSKAWIFLNCYLHSDLFLDENWRQAYHFITSNHQIPHTMELTFTNDEVRTYLNRFYSRTYRKNNQDHWYNYRNRKTIAVPQSSDIDRFTEQELIDLFGDKAEHPGWVEIIRFKTFTNHQTS
jgi:hypothetical protein